MCVSPANLNLREARQLEWETLSSDEEDDLPSSWTGLGLPIGHLDSIDTDLSPRSSGSIEVAVFPRLSQAHQLAAEVDHQFRQLQLVGAGSRQCVVSQQEAAAYFLKKVFCRWKLSVGWGDFMHKHSRFSAKSSPSCRVLLKTCQTGRYCLLCLAYIGCNFTNTSAEAELQNS